jgi:hypothetical protein
MADLMGSDRPYSPAETPLLPDLIRSLFRLPRFTKCDDFESLAKEGAIILVPGSVSIDAEVRKPISDEIEGRIQRCEIPERAVENARRSVEGRAAKVLAAVRYVPESTSADQAEEIFYSSPGFKPGRVVILDRFVDVPRPPVIVPSVI